MIFPKPEILSHKAPNKIEAKLSILIPSWNNLTMLKFCVMAIDKNSEFEHQIIIHVNEGKDGTIDWVKEQGFDYTFSETNAGVCYSVNAMAKLATSPLLLYLNDDMYVCPKWDKYLLDEVNNQKDNNWYFSGTMIEPKGYNNCAVTPYDFGSGPDDFREDELLKFAANVKKQDWFGSCWPPALVQKELFDAVGGYSEEFSPGMYSDPDFAMKLWQAGVRNFKGIGKCLVYHFQSRSTGRVKKNNGRKQFAAKWKVPSSYFYKNVLLMGQPYEKDRKLVFHKGFTYLFARLRAFYTTRFK